MQRGGLYDDLRAKLAQTSLNEVVKDIEFYRLSKGEYPSTLDELKKSLPQGSIDAALLIDPRISVKQGEPQYFYYERVGASHYYLRGVAPDGQPFSAGALVPQVTEGSANLGLLSDPPNTPPDHQ